MEAGNLKTNAIIVNKEQLHANIGTYIRGYQAIAIIQLELRASFSKTRVVCVAFRHECRLKSISNYRFEKKKAFTNFFV